MGSALTSPLMGLGLGMAGTATQTYASYNQAKAENEAAQWNAMTLEQNALLSEKKGAYALAAGETAAAEKKMDVGKLIGQQRAGYAASGVKVDEGSALDVQADTAAWGNWDEQKIRHNARMQAWEYDVDAANQRQQAAMTRAGKRNPLLAGGSTLLSGTTSLLHQYGVNKL